MGKIRRQNSSQIKLEAAIAMLSGKSPVSELCQKYAAHPTVLQRWKTELQENGVEIFNRRKKKKDDGTVEKSEKEPKPKSEFAEKLEAMTLQKKAQSAEGESPAEVTEE